MMKLPFLKQKSWPRIGPAQDEKLVQGSSDDLLWDHCIGELFDAIQNKDVKGFRKALEALVMACFDFDEGDKDAA